MESELDAVKPEAGLAIPQDYPKAFPLQSILREWNPDDVRIPAHYPKYNSLKYFDFQVCAWGLGWD